MTPEIEPGFFAKFSDWIVGAFSVLTGVIYKFHRGQIEEIKSLIGVMSTIVAAKADSSEVNRQRDHIADIYKRTGVIEVSTARIEENIKSILETLKHLNSRRRND